MNTAVGSGAYAAPEVQCPVGGRTGKFVTLGPLGFGAQGLAEQIWTIAAIIAVCCGGSHRIVASDYNAGNDQRHASCLRFIVITI